MNPEPEATSPETQRVQTSLNGLASISALPARWKGRTPDYIVSTLLEGVLAMLDLEFACLRLVSPIEGVPLEAARLQPGLDTSLVDRLWQAVNRWLATPGTPASRSVANPLGNGQVAVAFIRLGIQENRGTLIVGARRQQFPDRTEGLLLQVAANQALIALDEAARAAALRREPNRAQPRSAGRSAQLRAVNVALEREIFAHERSEEERLLLASLVENSTDFIALSSVRGDVWYVNAAGQELVGLSGDAQVHGTLMSDYIGPDHHWKLEHEIVATLERVGRWEGEVTFRHFMTGADVPMLAHVFFVTARCRPEPIGIATISRNITERKREEQELLVLKDELAAELAAMTRLHEFSTRLLSKGELSALLTEVLVATMGLQNADFGNVQLLDPGSGRLDIVAHIGFSDEFLEYFRDADAGATCGCSITCGSRVIIEDVLTDDRFEYHRAIAGSEGFRAMQSTPLFGTDGHPLGVVSTHFRKPHRPSERDLRFTDMYARLAALAIERQRTQTALRRSEFHLAEAQRVCHIGSWVFNTATGDVLWSDELCRILGFTPTTVTPSQDLFWDVIHDDDRISVREHFELALDQHEGFDQQFRLALSDGTVRHVHAFSLPVLDDTKNVLEYVGTMVDITQRKLAQDATRRAENELARVGRAMTIGELTASIAHELNQPLAAVATNANACLRWLAATPSNVREADACARRIVKDAYRASAVITRIRSLLTRSEPQKASLLIDDIVTDVVSLVQGEARVRGVTVQVQAPKSLPSFLGDRIQLQQVLLNLTMNAIEAMRSVSERSRIVSIRVALNGDSELRFEVSDTGPGLAPEHRARVFDAFYTTKEQGMGMGLTICRSIIDAHGGRLWVEPNAGPGETFQFTLPTSSG